MLLTVPARTDLLVQWEQGDCWGCWPRQGVAGGKLETFRGSPGQLLTLLQGGRGEDGEVEGTGVVTAELQEEQAGAEDAVGPHGRV